ncbi:hypothetical protein D3C81_694060 [compost metagenome]
MGSTDNSNGPKARASAPLTATTYEPALSARTLSVLSPFSLASERPTSASRWNTASVPLRAPSSFSETAWPAASCSENSWLRVPSA